MAELDATIKCFFCDRYGVLLEDQGKHKDKVLIIGVFGKKAICEECASQLYDILSCFEGTKEEEEDPFIEKEEHQ